MKPSRIFPLLLLLVLAVLFLTNPSLEGHKKAIAEFESAHSNVARVPEDSIQRDNYFIFSRSKWISAGNEEKLGFGMLGKVWLSSLEELPKTAASTGSTDTAQHAAVTAPADSPIKDNTNVKLLPAKIDSNSKIKEAVKSKVDTVNKSLANVKTDIAVGKANLASASAKEIRIGKYTWMTFNLDVSKFRNGDPIPEAKTDDEWVKAGEDGKPAWCYYDNDPDNEAKYGKLYNWFALTDPRGLAPQGWRIPNQAEWGNVIDAAGGESTAGNNLKASMGWGKNSNGTNSLGFLGMPAGFRVWSGSFKGGGSWGFWWTSSEGSDKLAWERYMNYGNSSVEAQENKRAGLAVRCIK